MVLLLLHFMLMLHYFLLLTLFFALLAALVSHRAPPFAPAYSAYKKYTIFLLSLRCRGYMGGMYWRKEICPHIPGQFFQKLYSKRH